MKKKLYNLRPWLLLIFGFDTALCLTSVIWLYIVYSKYSKIPILRPPLELSKSGLKDHFWTVPKAVSNQRHTGCRK